MSVFQLENAEVTADSIESFAWIGFGSLSPSAGRYWAGFGPAFKVRIQVSGHSVMPRGMPSRSMSNPLLPDKVTNVD